jgi:hypothetical protein
MIRSAGLVASFVAGPIVAVTLWGTLWSYNYALWDTNLMMLTWFLLPACLTAPGLAWGKTEQRLPLALTSGLLGFVLTYVTFIVWGSGQLGS